VVDTLHGMRLRRHHSLAIPRSSNRLTEVSLDTVASRVDVVEDELAVGDGWREAGSVVEVASNSASHARPARSWEPAAAAALLFSRPLHPPTKLKRRFCLGRGLVRVRVAGMDWSWRRLSSLAAFFL
jgi:hypothetical protein